MLIFPIVDLITLGKHSPPDKRTSDAEAAKSIKALTLAMVEVILLSDANSSALQIERKGGEAATKSSVYF